MDYKKNSNIELFRLICMLLIIMHHAVFYSDVIHSTFGANKIIANIIYIGGKFGANVFIAISAWFLIQNRFRLNRAITVWRTTFFYSVLFFVLNYIFHFSTYGIRNILEVFFPISFKAYWFVTAYIGLFLISPFLNKVIYALNQRQYRILLIILLLMNSVPVTFLIFAKPYLDESHLFLCILIYFIIGYYKRDFETYRSKSFLIKCFGFGMLWMILSAIGLICIGHSLNIAMLENNGTLWMNGESLPMILASMSSAVIVLKHLPNRSNPLINKLARGSFDIYLIHMNHFVYFWLWNKAIPISSFYDKPYFIFFICGSGIVVFLISLFIGNIRSSISAVVWSKVKWNKLQSIIDKVDTIVNQQEGERE